jgi:acyl-CoA thioester hydrolase
MSPATSQVFRSLHRVPYSLCTLGDHVYYARYLDLLEAARGEFFRALGKTFLEWQSLDTIFPVTECHLKYHAAARYDDLLTIEIQVAAAKGARLNLIHRVLNQTGALVLVAETFHACASLANKPKRLPEELLKSLQPFLSPV